jgi:hypothetical protein
LRFADVIAVESRPATTIDRFSSVYVDGRRCPFRSLIEIQPPGEAEAAAAQP